MLVFDLISFYNKLPDNQNKINKSMEFKRNLNFKKLLEKFEKLGKEEKIKKEKNKEENIFKDILVDEGNFKKNNENKIVKNKKIKEFEIEEKNKIEENKKIKESKIEKNKEIEENKKIEKNDILVIEENKEIEEKNILDIQESKKFSDIQKNKNIVKNNILDIQENKKILEIEEKNNIQENKLIKIENKNIQENKIIKIEKNNIQEKNNLIDEIPPITENFPKKLRKKYKFDDLSEKSQKNIREFCYSQFHKKSNSFEKLKLSDHEIPKIIFDLIKFLENHKEEKGIFRLCGREIVYKKLYELIINSPHTNNKSIDNDNIDTNINFNDYLIRDLTSALKLFIKNYKLIPNFLSEILLNLPEKEIQKKSLFLPFIFTKNRRILFQKIINLFKKIENMNLKSLSVCSGPFFFECFKSNFQKVYLMVMIVEIFCKVEWEIVDLEKLVEFI